MSKNSRRSFLRSSMAAMIAASMAAPAIAAEPILIGVPTAQSGPVGVADQQDYLNGTMMAIEEINAAGGVNGRMLVVKVVDIDIMTPEGTVAAFQNLTEAGVSAISSSFVLIPQAAMDADAAAGVPYLYGNTQKASLDLFQSNPEKYRNIFMVDADETTYGKGFIQFITDLKAAGKWTPKNNKVHIDQGQIAYTQVISQATQDAIAASGGEWEVGAITDIQFPVQDWGPVIQALKDTDAGVIMIDSWVAAQLASFAQTYAYDPVPGALVYLQYGPSQPEFRDLAGEAANGMIWGSTMAPYTDEQGMAFRNAYKAKHPGTMGLAYTGSSYDTIKLLAQVWETVDPSDFDAVGDAIRKIRYRGTIGWYSFDNDTQSGTSYPTGTSDPEVGQAHGMFQIQDGENKSIWPAPFNQTEYQDVPW